MNIGIGISLANYRPVPTVPLDPDAAIAALFESGEVGAWYDPSDSSTVWQNAAGTTPATVGDPVGRIDDKSGNGNHATQSTSAARPVLQQSGGLYYLDFDGVDDWMSTTFASAQAQPNTIGVGFKFDNYTSFQYDFVYDSPGVLGIEPRHALRDNNGIISTVAGTQLAVGSPDIADHVVTTHYNTTSSTVRLDGSIANTGDVGSLGWGGVVLGNVYDKRSGYGINGRIYSFVGVNRTLTAGEITDLETYLAVKSGVTL